MSNFFLKTLYQKRFLLLWWFIGICAVTTLTMSLYHSFQATDIAQVIKGLPPGLQKVAGDQASFTSIEGYIRQQIFTLRFPLLMSILSISLLVGLTAGDEQRGLLETQLTMPVSRTELLLQKLAAALIIIANAGLGAIAGILIALIALHETASTLDILRFTLNGLTISLVYGLVAFTIAALTGKRSLALGIGSGFAFGSYLIDSLAASVPALASINKLTFFHYYQNNPFAWHNYIILITVAVLLVIISIIGFKSRDIRTN